MTLTDLNALGYYLSSLSQTRDFKRFACTVRPCSGLWWGHAEGSTIEECLSAAYETCRDMEMFGHSKRQIRISFYNEEEPQKQLSLEDLGMVKPLKRRNLSNA